MDKWYNAAMARLVELQSAEGPVGGIQVFSAAPRQIPLANMKVTTKISIDLTRPNIGARVDAMQGDGNTRYVEASLLSRGRPWVPPAGVEVAVVYRKPDGTKGLYNKLADGTPAISSDGNVVTITLAPQMLTVPGTVQASVVFNNAQLDQLTSFPFTVAVTENQYAGAPVSEDYIRLEWLEDKLDEYLQKAADSGAFKGDPFTYEDFTPAQLAALRGPAGKSAYQYAVEGGYTGTEAEFSALVAYDSRKQIELVKDTMIRLHEGVTNDASGTVIALSDASSGPLQGMRIYGKTTQDGTPTPDNPVELVSVGDGGSVGVTVAGKNLLNAKNFVKISGINYQNISDNGYTIEITGGATSGYSYSQCVLTDLNLNGKNIVFKLDSIVATNTKTGVAVCQLCITRSNGKKTYKTINNASPKLSVGVPDDAVTVLIGVYANNTPSALSEANTVTVSGLMVALEDVDWEPYKSAQTLPISTPNGLPGIPVTSGGNYTDDSGQQWICDELDFARGVYVQRVYKGNTDGLRWTHEKNGSNFYECRAMLANVRLMNGGVMSTHFAKSNENKMIIGGSNNMLYARFIASTGIDTIEKATAFFASNSVTFIAALYTPIETPIPEDELAAYAALHTNKPNTTIYNNAGAHMDVEYVADTKLYIDQKINELATAIVSST